MRKLTHNTKKIIHETLKEERSNNSGGSAACVQMKMVLASKCLL